MNGPRRDPAALAPLVRVRDASLTPEGGPVRVTVSRLSSPEAVAEALAAAGARSRVEDGRLTTVTTPSRLVDAAGRTLGRPVADALERALTGALAAWYGPPPDVELSSGRLPCRRRTVVMGILNVTPDSFSDGGRFYDPADHPGLAVEHGRWLATAGADLVDVGGESSRPGAMPVPEDEELRRVLPVVEALAGEGIQISIDTTKAAVARAATEAGATVVNDVSAGAIDGLMLPTVAQLGVGYVLMHMRGTPRTMQRDPAYADVVGEVFDFLGEGLERCADSGVDLERVIIDPGIGFGKTVEHNLMLLRRLREFTSLGRPVLVGTSRKSFLGRVTGGLSELERMEASVASAAVAVAHGAAMVRVHDVTETVRAVQVARAIATGGSS
ncbi:MAG TPA: dihydropteroate synthase [Nitriliruptorales bacterium]|nr:dihydropteroate synthase [Nitriliruptorales bacterium]